MATGYYVEKLSRRGEWVRRAGPRKTIEEAQCDLEIIRADDIEHIEGRAGSLTGRPGYEQYIHDRERKMEIERAIRERVDALQFRIVEDEVGYAF